MKMEATRKALSLSEMEVWKQIGTLCQGPYSPPNQTWQTLKLALSFDQVAFPCLSYILLITFRWPIINFPLLASHASLIWMCCILSHYISKNRADMTLTFDCGWHNIRIRIGHSYLTQCYLLKGEDQPECIACNTSLTIKHIFIECVDFNQIRWKYFNVISMEQLFNTIPVDLIISYFKEIGLFTRL